MKWFEEQEQFLAKLPYKLEYNDEKHKYFVDGKEVPSVNKIIDKVFNREYKGDPIYGEIGTAAAKAIELDLREELDETTVDDYVRPRLEAFRGWVENEGATVIYSEMPLYSDGVAGRFDGMFEINGEPWLIDYKCVKQLQHFTVKVQLSGYWKLIKSIIGESPRLAALQLKDDGTYHLESYFVDADKLWNATMTLYREKTK